MKWISTTEKEKWSEENRFSEKEGKKLVIGEKIGKPLYGWDAASVKFAQRRFSDFRRTSKKKSLTSCSEVTAAALIIAVCPSEQTILRKAGTAITKMTAITK